MIHLTRDGGKGGGFSGLKGKVIWDFTLDFEAEDAGDWAVGLDRPYSEHI